MVRTHSAPCIWVWPSLKAREWHWWAYLVVLVWRTNQGHQSSMGRLLSLGFSEASGENRFFSESSGSAELEKAPQAWEETHWNTEGEGQKGLWANPKWAELAGLVSAPRRVKGRAFCKYLGDISVREHSDWTWVKGNGGGVLLRAMEACVCLGFFPRLRA